MQAMIGLGVKEDAGAFLHWLLHATRLTWPKLKIMYDIYGRTNLHERELAHLAGYRESRPVRIGNGAHRQQQTDVYGEVILAAYSYAAAGGVIDRAGARMLAGLGEVVHGIWREPDSGIWEMRGAPRQFTFSKVMCWTALDRLIALDEIGAVRLGDKAATYKADRTAIAQVIEARGFNNAIKAYTGELDGDTVDASLLLMSSVGYKKASDPRIKSTTRTSSSASRSATTRAPPRRRSACAPAASTTTWRTSLNWFMPALVNNSVGSFAGTSEEEWTILCPCCSK